MALTGADQCPAAVFGRIDLSLLETVLAAAGGLPSAARSRPHRPARRTPRRRPSRSHAAPRRGAGTVPPDTAPHPGPQVAANCPSVIDPAIHRLRSTAIVFTPTRSGAASPSAARTAPPTGPRPPGRPCRRSLRSRTSSRPTPVAGRRRRPSRSSSSAPGTCWPQDRPPTTPTPQSRPQRLTSPRTDGGTDGSACPTHLSEVRTADRIR